MKFTTASPSGMARRLRSLGIPLGCNRDRSIYYKRRDPVPKRGRCDRLNKIMRMLRTREIE